MFLAFRILFQIVSLLKHTGISLPELQAIPCTTEEEVEEAFSLPDEPDFELTLSKNEQVIICYVAGYAAHSIVRNHVKCADCKSLFIVTDGELPSAEYEGSEHTEFIQIMTRGKLKSPSNNLFLFCQCCYILFVTIQSSVLWPDFLKLKSPLSAFKRLLLHCIRSSQFSNLLSATCANNHRFSLFASMCATIFFNVMAKNFVQSVRQKKVATASKVRKLQSS